MTTVSGLSVTRFLDPLPIPPVITVPPHQELWQLQITMRTACVTLHSQLPPTTVWTYNGSFPGPTIRVRRGQKLRVNWQNEITGNFPVTAVQVQGTPPFPTPGPGRDGATPPGSGGAAAVDGGAPARGADRWRQRRLDRERGAAG